MKLEKDSYLVINEANNSASENRRYAMCIYEDPNYESSCSGNKSKFFFDNRIICLGSNIENDRNKYKTETMLFQNSLKTKSEPIWVSGSAREDFDFKESLYTKSFLSILDNKEKGYYIPGGHRVSIGKCNKNPRSTSEITSGDYAFASIDHGISPKYEGYEYAILTKTNLEGIKAFCHKMIFEETALYTVLQCNKYVHIVKDKETNITGYAVFNCGNLIDKGFVKDVDSPVMIMTKEKEEGLTISLTLRKGISSKGVTLTLDGCWGLKTAGKNYKIISNKKNETAIWFNCQQGEPIEIELTTK